MKGCRRDLTPYTLCGDTVFDDNIQLCNDCEKKYANCVEDVE